jgi:TRAP-type C4-dicarboxylate transport system substrate-binding protein
MPEPIRMKFGGYGPPTTHFSRGMKVIGDSLVRQLGARVAVDYLWNVMDEGLNPSTIPGLAAEGKLTLGYLSTSSLADEVKEVGVTDLPFLFASEEEARAAMDGALGQFLTQRMEAAHPGFRVLGYFENGFRHVSNRLRPVREPADMKGLRIRALDSAVQVRTLELLGTIPFPMGLPAAIKAMTAGEVDAQENPFANTVTYGVHKLHKFHTATNHFYISRGIFVNRAAFESWPADVQAAMRAAVREGVEAQRGFAVAEERDSRRIIEESGGEVLDLTPAERAAFVAAVQPVYEEARKTAGEEVFRLLPRQGAVAMA